MSDREPPAFPSVSDTPADPAEEKTVQAPIFSRAGGEAPAPAAPVTSSYDGPPPASSAPLTARDYRARWAVVGVATLVIVALVGAFLVFGGPKGGTPSTVARYAPADTVSYVEARLDLPGDQHDALAAFMSHFPGFADQAAFDQKFEETLNQMLASSESGMTWQADIEPWFGGQIGVFTSSLDTTADAPPAVGVALSVKDTAAFDSWVDAHLQPGAQSEDYQGQLIWTGLLFDDGGRVSFAATNDAVVVSPRVEDVKAGLDAHADRAPGLADDAFFLQQLGALHADYLGLAYYDGRGAAEDLREQLEQLGDMGQAVPPAFLEWVIDSSSSRAVLDLRAETDHLSLTTRSGDRPADADLPPLPGNRSTTLAETVPVDVLAYAEVRDVGKSISFVLGKLLEPTPGASPLPIDLSEFEGILGVSIEDYFDFIVDAGVSVTMAGDEPTVGLVATVDDSAIAESRVDRLLTMARTLMQFGEGVKFENQEHNGAKITVMTIDGSTGEDAIASISLSVANGRLYIGNGDFVVSALDRTRDASLAARPEYVAALQAGGTSNAGVMWFDIAAGRGLIESFMSAADLGDYELNTKPFVEPLSHLAVVNVTEGSTAVSHVFLYVE